MQARFAGFRMASRMSRAKKTPADRTISSDVILAMQDPYMDQIIEGRKNYEFRKYCINPSVKRLWFYRTAPHSSITHVCETMAAHTRKPSDPPLVEDGLGNAEFNKRDKAWAGWNFAYKIVTLYELERPITLKEMREKHGFKSPPRRLVYLPKSIDSSVNWKQQRLLIDRRKQHSKDEDKL